MLRQVLARAAVAAAVVAASFGPALAEEVGRYQIVQVPLGIEGELAGSAVLLDTATGRTWHVMIDDKGRPRWRGIEFAGGSQGVAEAPAEAQAEAQAEAAASDN